MRYGLAGATAMIVWTLGEYAAGLHGPRVGYERYTGWVVQLILVLTLWRLLRAQVHAAGTYWLPVWKGLWLGLIASLVAGMGYHVFLSLYVNFIHPEFPDLYLEWHVAHLRAAGQSEENIRAMARGFRWSMSPTGMLVTVIGMNLLIGFVASPILTLWLNWRRKEVADVR